MLLLLSLTSVCAAATPAVLTVVNLREYREPPSMKQGVRLPAMTVVVPARNEEAGIAACIESVLRSVGMTVRVLVLDDGSTDGTAAIVCDMAAQDSRLSLQNATSLPAGWNGKQHACWLGAQAAVTPLLCFVDADVRLEPEALARMATLLVHGDSRPCARNTVTEVATASGDGRPRPGAVAHGFATALVSGFPWEQTATPLEWLLLPLIHFVLLGLLPMRLLRTTTISGFGAGCGQFLMVDRDAYFAVGGHAAIRETMHDGVRLPRLLRAHGYGTRLADLTALARCRMYHSAATTWNGLAKNATEGLGSPGTIVPMTLMLGLGQVLPLPLLAIAAVRVMRRRDGDAVSGRDVVCMVLAAGAVALSYAPRVLQAKRFHHAKRSVALHPIGVATLLTLQWIALGRKLLGRPATWKARSYPAN